MRQYFVESVGEKKKRARTILARGLLVSSIFAGVGYLLIVTSEGPDANAAPAVAAIAPALELPPAPKMVTVLVPSRGIEAGTKLQPELFHPQQIAEKDLAGDAVQDREEIVGMYARVSLLRNQPVAPDSLSSESPSKSVMAHIPEGFRAVSISVDARSAVEGWAFPGARVDVTWTSEMRGEQTVSVIVENAKVLSAEHQTEIKADSQGYEKIPSTVTLLVTAKDAAKIHLASTAGRLNLSLRGDGDSGKSDPIGTFSLTDLLASNRRATPEDADLEGSLRVRNERGDVEEWNIRRGRLVRPHAPEKNPEKKG